MTSITTTFSTEVESAELQDDFVRLTTEIGWYTVATVDQRDRPRTCILHASWEIDDGRLIGWVSTSRSPRKTAHLARNSYVSCSNWSSAHDAVFADLGGSETAFPRSSFQTCSTVRVSPGLCSVPRTRETTGPDEVWAALRELCAERVGHGIGAALDPRLLDHLAEHRIPLEVCSTSNVCAGAAESLAAQPLPELLAHGVIVTLGTEFLDCSEHR
jgi:hypothetical protein